MKKLFTLLALSLIALPGMAALYYTCNTPSGTNLTSDPTGGGTCNIDIATWNLAGNTIFVRAGTSLTLTSAPFNMNCNITIIDGGTLTYNSGISSNNPNNAFNILAGKVMVVNGDFVLTQNNCELSIAAANPPDPKGLLVVNATGSVNNGGNGNTDIIIDGDITGTGTIDFGGTISGSGTINGQPAGGQMPPIQLDVTGIIWNGTQWVDQNGDPTAAPANLVDRAIFNGNYSSAADGTVGPNWPGDGITINSGFTVSFDDDDNLINIITARVDGIVELVDDTKIATFIVPDPASIGQIKLTRNFTRAGWQHLSFPINTTLKGVGDLVKTGTPFDFTNSPSANIYYWDAATAGWVVPAPSTLLNRPYNIYSYGAGEAVSLTISLPEFSNRNDYDQPYSYFANTTGPNVTTPGNADNTFGINGWVDAVVDGWNMFANPFQAYINSADLNASFTADIDAGVHVWDGNSYQVNPTAIAPHQAYFVHANAGSGNFTIQTSVRDNAATGSSYFKKNEELIFSVSGAGVTAQTSISENMEATDRFDSRLDAYYLVPPIEENTVILNSAGADSLMYAKNQLPYLREKPIYLTFYHLNDGIPFNLSLDASGVDGQDVVIVEDLHTGEFTDLLRADYSFVSVKNAPEQRFKAHFTQESANKAQLTYGTNFKFWSENNQLMFEENTKFEGAEFNVFNLSGQLVAEGSTEQPIYIFQPGLYIIRIITKDSEVFSEKVLF